MTDKNRTIGFLGATGVGVGAIVGGGILALAGIAFSSTGPSAIIAFALNGVIAMLTALSFSEMASRFPESGGTYTFSRKVLSVESAFTVGWVVWFASIVAAVLYAQGFAAFFILFVAEICSLAGWSTAWASTAYLPSALAIATTLLMSAVSMLRNGGGGVGSNIVKVIVFAVLIMGGLYALVQQDTAVTSRNLTPFFASGIGGLVQAMGYSFIALQGFDLIAAVGGEVKNPGKTIPRAMIVSLVIALLIYLPLLFMITTVGVPPGQSVTDMAKGDSEALVANAVKNFLGTPGYWLVLVAGVLSMFTAMQANLFAASRIGLAMARDRTLPKLMSQVNSRRGIPVGSVLVTGLLTSILIVALPDVAAAGAASSLIFLVTFAIAHWLCILVRIRSPNEKQSFRTPFFPAIPVVGGVACLGLAIFQGAMVPAAGAIATIWLGLGGLLFLTLFARSARLKDISSVAANPELNRLRGSTPLVLVPISNPANAEAMIALANILVPRGIGRVLLQNIVVASLDSDPEAISHSIERSQSTIGKLLSTSARLGIRTETLVTVGPEPIEEIARVARLHRCQSVLLGLSEITEDAKECPTETLLGRLDADVVIVRAPKNWHLVERQRILVPVGGRGGHDHLLVRLLASLARQQQCDVTFIRVISADSTEYERRRAAKELRRMAGQNFSGAYECQVICHDHAIDAIVEATEGVGVLILGVQRIDRRKRLFGTFTRQVAQRDTLSLDCDQLTDGKLTDK